MKNLNWDVFFERIPDLILVLYFGIVAILGLAVIVGLVSRLIRKRG